MARPRWRPALLVGWVVVLVTLAASPALAKCAQRWLALHYTSDADREDRCVEFPCEAALTLYADGTAHGLWVVYPDGEPRMIHLTRAEER